VAAKLTPEKGKPFTKGVTLFPLLIPLLSGFLSRQHPTILQFPNYPSQELKS